MAKDGTNRGGRRVRAGDEPAPLGDMIVAGKAIKVLEALFRACSTTANSRHVPNLPPTGEVIPGCK